LAGVETSIARGEWLDPARSAVTVASWAEQWLATRGDLRASTRARLAGVVRHHVIAQFGPRRLATIGNAEIRQWVAQMSASGLSAASTRKAVFALRMMLAAAVADRRLSVNPATAVPLPAEHACEQRFLSQSQVWTLADTIAVRYRALVLLGAFGGLRWGELAGLRRSRVDVLRSRVTIAQTATDVGGQIAFGEPKTAKSRRVVPIARSIMREVEAHMAEHVGPEADALVFTGATGGPMYRGTFWPTVWRPAVTASGLDGLRIHDLRHTFVAIMTAAGAGPKEVSTWAGHSSVSFTYDRYGHLYEDHADDVADRLDVLLTARRERDASVRAIGRN